MGPHLAPSPIGPQARPDSVPNRTAGQTRLHLPIGPDDGGELGAGNEVEPGSVARVLLVDGSARLDVKRVGAAAVHGARGDAHVVVTRRGNAVAPALGVEGPLSRLDAPQGTFEPLTRHAPMKAEADVGVRRGVEDVVALVLRVGHAKAVLRAAGRGMHLQAEVAATHGVEVRRGGTRGAPCQGVPGPPATALHPRTAIPASRTTMVGCWSLDTPRVASSPPIGMRFLLTHRGTFAGLPLTAAIASLPGAGPPSPIARFGGLPHHPPQSRLGIAPFCYNNGNGTRPQGAGREAP